jgi:hypothetical protein
MEQCTEKIFIFQTKTFILFLVYKMLSIELYVNNHFYLFPTCGAWKAKVESVKKKKRIQ